MYEPQQRHDGVTPQRAELAARRVASESAEKATDFQIFKELRLWGIPAREIALRHSIGACVVYKRSDRFGAKVRGVLADIPCLAAATLVLFLIASRAFVHPTVTATAPGPEQVLPALSTHLTPRAVRALALEKCSAKQFEVCISLLDHAKRSDPEGDGDPAIQAARSDAANALNEPMKVGPKK